MRRIRNLAAVLAVVFVCLSVSSCSAWDSFMASLGFDTRDYSHESVDADRLGDEKLEAEITDAIGMLTMNEPKLAEFSSSAEAIVLCRDSVLNHMLDVNFSRYTGNIEMLDAAAEKYPQIKITNIIPASEFDQMYYRFFGGATKITSTSGEYFAYLDKLDAYTALSHPLSPDLVVDFTSIGETKNTYRVRLSVKIGENESPKYDIILIKRDDGTMYFREVKEVK